jgi:predicted enzyme related to lactoylglutathione lyase
MPRVIHFEISANEPEKTVSFYENVFGWQFHKWEGPQDYWLITTGQDGQPGINGGLMPRREPNLGTINTLDVPAVDAYVAKVEAAGGAVIVPKMAVPGVGWLAYFKDPEGNVFGMMQADEKAA